MLHVVLAFFCVSTANAQDLVYIASGERVDSVSFQETSSSTDKNAESNAESEASEQIPPLANLRVSGQIRHRSELNARYASSEDAPRFHLLRTRLNVSFEPTNDVTALVQIQDSRLFGGEDPRQGRGTLDGTADALDFHQAYFAVNNLFKSNVRLKVGRQEMAYGNESLIGVAGWSNIGVPSMPLCFRMRTNTVLSTCLRLSWWAPPIVMPPKTSRVSTAPSTTCGAITQMYSCSWTIIQKRLSVEKMQAIPS